MKSLFRLRCFLALAEELHFGRAARRVGISQPPFTRHIQTLERDVGVALFSRGSRRVDLTPCGRALLAKAAKVVDSLDEFAREASALTRGRAIRIGYVSPALPHGVVEFARRLSAIFPDARIALERQGTRSQLRKLDAGELDFGFTRPFREQDAGPILARDAYGLALRSDHALATRAAVEMEEIDAAPLILFARTDYPEVHDSVHAALAQARARCRIVAEPQTKIDALQLVASGAGVAIVPSAMQVLAPPSVRFVPLKAALPPVLIDARAGGRLGECMAAAGASILDSMRRSWTAEAPAT